MKNKNRNNNEAKCEQTLTTPPTPPPPLPPSPTAIVCVPYYSGVAPAPYERVRSSSSVYYDISIETVHTTRAHILRVQFAEAYHTEPYRMLRLVFVLRGCVRVRCACLHSLLPFLYSIDSAQHCCCCRCLLFSFFCFSFRLFFSLLPFAFGCSKKFGAFVCSHLIKCNICSTVLSLAPGTK